MLLLEHRIVTINGRTFRLTRRPVPECAYRLAVLANGFEPIADFETEEAALYAAGEETPNDPLLLLQRPGRRVGAP